MKISHTNSLKSRAGRLLLDVFEKNWRGYLTELVRCKTEFSNEAVHDFRIATQKAMWGVQLLNALFPRPRLQKASQAFEAQLADLGEVRDIQVILAENSEMIQEFPELHSFQKYQLGAEEKALRALRKKITKFDPADLSRRIRKERHFLETKMKDNLGPHLMQAVDDAFQSVKHHLGWVNPARPVTIQRVGTAFQSFLYRAEVIYPLLEEFSASQLERMNHYQSLISEVQDANMFLQTLAELSEREVSSDIKAVRHYYECRYEEAIDAYTSEMDRLHLFWRPSAPEPFPWNKAQ